MISVIIYWHINNDDALHIIRLRSSTIIKLHTTESIKMVTICHLCTEILMCLFICL